MKRNQEKNHFFHGLTLERYFKSIYSNWVCTVHTTHYQVLCLTDFINIFGSSRFICFTFRNSCSVCSFFGYYAIVMLLAGVIRVAVYTVHPVRFTADRVWTKNTKSVRYSWLLFCKMFNCFKKTIRGVEFIITTVILFVLLLLCIEMTVY